MDEFNYRVRIDSVFDNKYETVKVKTPFVVSIDRNLCMWSYVGWEKESDELILEITHAIVNRL